MRVVFFHRRPVPGHFSIEGYFEQVRAHLPRGVEPSVRVSRFVSRGLLRRLYNLVEAAFRQGEVNHVTGDVHYLTFLLRRSRTVLTIHDCEPLERMTGLRRLLMLWLWYRIPARRAAVLTVNSEATRRELLKHVEVDPARVEVVPVCIAPDFRPRPGSFDADRPRILQVGTNHNKNVPRLAAALDGVPCRLTLVGSLDDGQREALERHGVDYTAVSNLSSREMVERYAAADLVTFASTYEGFGMPILEAQAVGRPVVTSDRLAMPEVAGGAACLVDPYDVDDIRAGIVRVIRDRAYRESLVEAGLRNVARFDPEVIARRYTEIYERLSRGNGGREAP